MQDMRDLYRAYSAVHDTTIKEELDTSKDQISAMNLGQLTEGDLLEVCEEIVEGLFQYGCVLDTAYEVVGSMMEATTEGELPAHRQQKIVRISEAFDKTFEKVATRAERNCEEEFLKYRTNKPLNEKWNSRVNNEVGNEKLHAALIHEDRETIKGGLIEMISDVIEARKPGEEPQDYADRMKKKYSGGKSKTYDPMKDKNFDHDKAERTRGSMEEGDSSYLETDMKKRQKNNEKARKDMEKVPGQKNPHFEEVSTLRQGWANAYASIYEKKLDPVGQEDSDIDNDGKKNTKSDKYLAKRREAIGNAMKNEGIDPKGAARMDAAKGKEKETQDEKDKRLMLGKYSPSVKYANMKKEEVDQYIDFLISEGYDCSDLTWDDMIEEYQSLDEGLRSAVMGFLGKKKEQPAKPMSRGDQLRKKYNVGPEKSDTSAKRQILNRTRAKAEKDQKEYGDSPYSKSVADKSKAAHERQLKGGYSKYGADDARGKGNKARKRAEALKKEEVSFSEAELKAFEQIVNSWVD